jgi:hypothetical protein
MVHLNRYHNSYSGCKKYSESNCYDPCKSSCSSSCNTGCNKPCNNKCVDKIIVKDTCRPGKQGQPGEKGEKGDPGVLVYTKMRPVRSPIIISDTFCLNLDLETDNCEYQTEIEGLYYTLSVEDVNSYKLTFIFKPANTQLLHFNINTVVPLKKLTTPTTISEIINNLSQSQKDLLASLPSFPSTNSSDSLLDQLLNSQTPFQLLNNYRDALLQVSNLNTLITQLEQFITDLNNNPVTTPLNQLNSFNDLINAANNVDANLLQQLGISSTSTLTNILNKLSTIDGTQTIQQFTPAGLASDLTQLQNILGELDNEITSNLQNILSLLSNIINQFMDNLNSLNNNPSIKILSMNNNMATTYLTGVNNLNNIKLTFFALLQELLLTV